MRSAIVIILLCCLSTVNAQQFTIKGKVIDRATSQPLSFANIRVANSTLGSAANINGEYEIKILNGTYKLVTSFIGYYSDTLEINLNNNIYNLNFSLSQTKVDLPEVVIKPGENPALEIVRKAIEKKKIRNQNLQGYEVEAYTKGIIRTTEDISSTGGGIGLSLGGSDTTELKITGILENHSKGFYKKPDKNKEIILARKQSANFPPSINTLTGGRFIQNFYSDNVNFFGRDISGPLAEDALDYYYYYIEKQLAINNLKVYQIYMTPDNSTNPGFEGSIFITDSTYDLIKVDLRLNRTANTGGIFDTINVLQQFSEYSNVFMPVDYRLFVKANYLGLVRVGFELNTILFDYKINSLISDEIFDKAIITVIPKADKIDSTYWKNTQTIPNTEEEEFAYRRIDSLENIPKKFLDDYSLLDSRINISQNISISAPIAFYHFNRVEGSAVDFGVFVNNVFDQRLNFKTKFSYGFSDKKHKQDFSAEYLLGNYRTVRFSLSVFNRLNVLFARSDNYREIISTLITLLTKYEFRDYFYSNGFDFSLEGEVFPILKLRAGILNKTDNSALNNSDFSFFSTDKSFRLNPIIYETRITALKAGFTIDFRDYIEDGYFRRRTSFGGSYINFYGDITYSNNNLISTGLDFTRYELLTRGMLRTFNSASLNFKIYGMYNNGSIAYQDLYSLPGNINSISNSLTFRTLNVNEVIGDRILSVNLEHDFRSEVFRYVPLIRKLELTLTMFLNSALTDISDESNSILPVPVKTFKYPFYEIGFGIGQAVFPFKLEFSWKLNHRNENNFRIGFNLLLL
jgi:hypothetical protein